MCLELNRELHEFPQEWGGQERWKPSGCFGVEQGAEFSSYGLSLSFLFTFSPAINNSCGFVQFASKEDIKRKWLSPCSLMGNYGATGSVPHLPGLGEDWPGSPQGI